MMQGEMAKRQFDYQVAARLYQSPNASCGSVARRLGVGEGAIRKALAKLGIPRRPKGRQRFDRRMIVRDYIGGLEPQAIAEARGCAVGTVAYIVRRAGVTPHRQIVRITIPEEATALAYLAGLIDGEGTIYSRRGKNGFTEHRISIINTDEELMRWLVAVIGGNVSWRCHARLGRKPVAAWTVSRKADTQAFLTAVRPYLRIKTAQADTALGHLATELA
jgi:hypothetical protein